MQSGKYRPDIDGLRAVAVVPVVLYHAGVPGFSGGFVGVDVFFVISGYLITNIILAELDQGKFSIINFYERRIRRIFPALFSLVAFVCIVAPTALLPSELRTLPYEVIGAVAFIANLVFWRQSDYFATAAEEKPLLHTWSLGVEEQFYIFSPLILWFLFNHARRWLPLVTFTTLALSLALCIYYTPTKPSAAFYLLPFRAWELLAGSLLAIGLPRTQNGPFSEGMATLGVILLLTAIFIYDEHTVFPGYAAILPVIGTALIIQFAEGHRVGCLLALPPLVFIGLLSYSVYLWHWPVIVFFRDWGLLETALGQILALVVSFLLAWLCWRFIESPFRKSGSWPRSKLFKFSTIGTGSLLLAAVALHVMDGWPNRFDPESVAFDEARRDISPERNRCHIEDGERPLEKLCRLGAEGGAEPDTVVWADSHGVELAAALAVSGLPIIQATYSACPPALGFVVRQRKFCKTHNDKIFEAIMSSTHIQTVVIAAFFSEYSSPQFWASMQDTLSRLQIAGKRVVVIGPLPNFGKDIPPYLAFGRRAPLPMTPVPSEFDEYITGDIVISPREELCQNGICPLIINGKPILFDDNHLSFTAALSIAPKIVNQIRVAP